MVLAIHHGNINMMVKSDKIIFEVIVVMKIFSIKVCHLKSNLMDFDKNRGLNFDVNEHSVKPI